MNEKHINKLKSFNACEEAVRWFAKQRTPLLAWRDCKRPDWLLWFAGKQAGEPGCASRRTLVMCVCECARLALPHVAAGEKRPLQAIETAEAWARGDAGVTLKQVQAAANAAYVAAYAAYAANAANAAIAADAAANAANAANAAYAANAANVAYAAARATTNAQCCGIIRKYYSKPPQKAAKAGGGEK